MESPRFSQEAEESASVLVVTQDREARGRWGDWLEEAGFSVMVCPGPTAPEYVCLAGRNCTCPIADAADAVVLDAWVAGDTVMDGMSANELLTYYRSRGKPVVSVTRGQQTAMLQGDDEVTPIAYPPERALLVGTTRAVVRRPFGVDSPPVRPAPLHPGERPMRVPCGPIPMAATVTRMTDGVRMPITRSP